MPEVPLIGAPREEKNDAPEFVEAKHAFILYVLEDGSVGLSTDLNLPVVTEGMPSQQDIWVAISTAKRNIEATEIAVQAAQLTINAQMQLGRQIMDQQQNAALMGQLGNIR